MDGQLIVAIIATPFWIAGAIYFYWRLAVKLDE
jgi:hypothetical protein